MAITNAQARQQLLDAVGEATDQLASALAYLGAAYERLDDHSADQLEEQLFRPVQIAYGRAQRTHSGFASRYDLPTRKFEPASAGAPHQDARHLIDAAVDAAAQADATLAGLQDSMLPVEFGDPELRAGLSGVRELIGDLRGRAREIVRTVGR
ncbi:MAG TPA: hypothetical protein VG295_06865 [Solirubrobacteraceae bacterium]|jgi:hypothetical protein|nr:hypothetical protein [Solirubrobacteraceae bacterium]